MTEAPTPTAKIRKAMWQHNNAVKNFDYTTVAGRLWTVSLSNDSHSKSVIKPVYDIPIFQLTAIGVPSEGHTFKNS